MERCLALSLILCAACEAETLGLDPNGIPPDAGPAGCMQTEASISRGRIAGASRFSSNRIAVSDGMVYSHRLDVGLRAHVIAFDPRRDREEVVGEPTRETILLGARRGAVLWAERTDPGAAASIVHRTERGPETIAVEQRIRSESPDAYFGREHRSVEPALAAWWSNGGVWRWDLGGEARPIDAEPGDGGDPIVRDGTVVWRIAGPGTRILLHEEGAMEPVTIANGDVAWPALGDSQLFFVDSGRLMRLDLPTGERALIHEGPCGPPSADGDRAVAACGGERGPFAPGELIAYWDGVTTHELFEDGGYHFAPRLDGQRIAWIRYRSADVLCTPPEGIAGEVRLWDPDLSAESIPLGEVSGPCLCCDAFWPPAELAIEGDLIAWSYALGGDRAEGSIGWALVERFEVCSP